MFAAHSMPSSINKVMSTKQTQCPANTEKYEKSYTIFCFSYTIYFNIKLKCYKTNIKSIKSLIRKADNYTLIFSVHSGTRIHFLLTVVH